MKNVIARDIDTEMIIAGTIDDEMIIAETNTAETTIAGTTIAGMTIAATTTAGMTIAETTIAGMIIDAKTANRVTVSGIAKRGRRMNAEPALFGVSTTCAASATTRISVTRTTTP